MLPDDVRKLRERIIHTQAEFADLLARLRGAPVSWQNIAKWEQGLRAKRVPIYNTDIIAIEQATTPLGPKCAGCGVRAIVRKNDTDLCGDCATPNQWGRNAKVKFASA